MRVCGKSTLITGMVKWQREMYDQVDVHDHFIFPSHGWGTGASGGETGHEAYA